jgi:BspA type Leucine rich repeat region (6 copies)
MLAALWGALPTMAWAQFTYITNADDTITITGYTGPGGYVTIPSTINGLPVTSIGDDAIYNPSLTSVMIPKSVTSIGNYAFLDDFSLAAINVDVSNPTYSSSDGVLFDKDQVTLVEFPPGRSGTTPSRTGSPASEIMHLTCAPT